MFKDMFLIGEMTPRPIIPAEILNYMENISERKIFSGALAVEIGSYAFRVSPIRFRIFRIRERTPIVET